MTVFFVQAQTKLCLYFHGWIDPKSKKRGDSCMRVHEIWEAQIKDDESQHAPNQARCLFLTPFSFSPCGRSSKSEGRGGSKWPLLIPKQTARKKMDPRTKLLTFHLKRHRMVGCGGNLHALSWYHSWMILIIKLWTYNLKNPHKFGCVSFTTWLIIWDKDALHFKYDIV